MQESFGTPSLNSIKGGARITPGKSHGRPGESMPGFSNARTCTRHERIIFRKTWTASSPCRGGGGVSPPCEGESRAEGRLCPVGCEGEKKALGMGDRSA